MQKLLSGWCSSRAFLNRSERAKNKNNFVNELGWTSVDTCDTKTKSLYTENESIIYTSITAFIIIK